MSRAFLIVLDSFGIGEAPDAAQFGDRDCNTLARIAKSPKFHADNLIRMGLGNIDGVSCLPRTDAPTATVARLTERSAGKDTTIGHWEIAGVVSPEPLPTYPHGFPDEILSALSAATGRGILCNKPYSGTDVIHDYGEQHMKTGDLIVYTSADSVFQIAAHEQILPPEDLYAVCRQARELLTGHHAVGRVIARPFIGTCRDDFTRTANRRDFSLTPSRPTLTDAVFEAGQSVIAVGKIRDIFAGRGITEWIPTHNNAEGMAATLAALDREFCGLCFINLVDFDMLYGHRQDTDGYAAAIAEFDRWLPTFTSRMRADDLLIITADHGCDPGDQSTDHSREYVPFLMYKNGISPQNAGTRSTFADVAATVAAFLQVPFCGDGFAIGY